MGDVCEEVTGIMEHSGVVVFKAKSSRRKYAFELPGIPKEGDYLKVLYPYTSMYRQSQYPTISNGAQSHSYPMNLQGRHSHVFLEQAQLFSSNLCFAEALWVLVG